MADDLKNPGPEDGRLISLTQDHEVRYWAGRFRVTPERLAEAVEAVGPGAPYVEAWLADHPE